MKISPTYTSRDNLSHAEKVRFTLEEHLAANWLVRATYRRYFFLPKETKDVVWAISFFLALVPMAMLVMAEGCFKGRLNEDSDGGLVLCIALAALALFAYLHIIGLVLLVALGQFLVLVWLSGVMEDYSLELRGLPPA